MASWQKIIVSGSKAELNSVGLVTSMSVGANQIIATSSAQTKLSGSFSGSFFGDGSQLTGVAATNVEYANVLNKPALVSASSQIDVRNTTGIATIATTGSNTFTGTQTIGGNIFLNTTNPIVYNNSANNSLLFGFYDGSTIYGPYFQIFGNNYATAAQRGGAEFVYDTRNGGDGNFHVSSYDGSTWVQRFRVDNLGTQVTGSLEATAGITGSFKGDGSQLTGIATVLGISGSTSGVDTVNLKTDALVFSGSSNVTATVTNNTVTIGVSELVSQSAQIDVRNTTGIATIATTGSNTFTGVQTISNTTNSTNYTDGALIVQGGVGIAKNVNISGSLNVTGLLTVASMSTQYVTSSQYNIGVSKITLNDDDIVRFAGLSVYDSGSTAGSGSLLWDSLNNRWIYENSAEANYNSAVIIAGPKNFGDLGNEVGLITGRIPVATGDDHIDTNIASSSIYIDFTNKKTHIEAGLVVTGSVTASAFSGDGSQLTGVSATSVEYANVLNKPALVSASVQIDHNATTNYVASQHVDHLSVFINPGDGLSGGGNIAANVAISLDTGSAHFTGGVKTKLNTDGVLSSSAQINAILDADGVLSSSAQVTAVLNSANVHSGSYLGTATTSNLPEGTNLYYLDTRVKDKLNTEGVVSSSAQIVAGVAGQTIAPTTINATTINASGNVTVTGDLTVNGTTTTLNTTNVLIEDRYILLNSGSVAGAPAQGGIVVQDGGTASGSAMLYSTENSKNRWGVAENVAANAANAIQTAYVATVTDMNVAAQASAVATYEKPGNIKIETNGDIYIWA